MVNKQLKLDAGCPVALLSKNPYMEIIGKGENAHVWIGNGGSGDRCFATISLEKFRNFVKNIDEKEGD